jgi:aryl-alcohol dehydrogenase-like predicted oxidoreductase
MAPAATSVPATFRIGGDLEVRRLGFGALRITGPDNWGEPADREAMLSLLRRLPDLGVDLVDTADSYGPHVSEQLLREALHPYGGLVVATKGGYVRPRPDAWVPLGRPEYLQQSARLSARRLGVERIDLWQLHRIDTTVPRDEQFDAIRQLRDEGLIRHVGLSQVGVEDLEAARAVFPVATVQNRYNVLERRSEAVLRYCERAGIGFIPYFPLAAGRLGQSAASLAAIGAKYGASVEQIALAWLLRHSPVMLPIPGTGRLAHLEQNVAAARIELAADDYAALSALAPTAAPDSVDMVE